MRYGKNHYDFDSGTMVFTAPRQVIKADQGIERNRDGWSLLFHPDLLKNFPMGKAVQHYGFFSYDVNEALHLSDEEDQLLQQLVDNLRSEFSSRPE